MEINTLLINRGDLRAVIVRIDAQVAEIERLKSIPRAGVLVPEKALADMRLELERLRADAARYQWLRRSLVKLSFSDSLIASLLKDQSELDAALKEQP